MLVICLRIEACLGAEVLKISSTSKTTLHRGRVHASLNWAWLAVQQQQQQHSSLVDRIYGTEGINRSTGQPGEESTTSRE